MRIKLDLNENAWGPPPAVMEAVRATTAESVSAYPETGPAAARIALKLSVEPAALLLTNGADEAIQAVFEAVLRPRDAVLLPVPTFSFYGAAARRRRARIVEIPYRRDWSFPLDAVLAGLGRRPRLAVVVSPNNPTGTRIGREALRRLLIRARRSIVLLDETYTLFAGRSHARLLKTFPNLVIVGSFSKFHGMAGLRLGYLLAGPALVPRLKNALPPYSVNAVALAAGEAALSDLSHQRRMKAELAGEKRRLARGMRGVGFRVFPSAANFFLVEAGDACARICGRLKDAGILVKDLSREPRLGGCFRVAVGRPSQNGHFLESLADAVPPPVLLFDMDGVLVDVSASYDAAIARTVGHFVGCPAKAAEIRALRLATGFNNDWDLTAALLASKGRPASRREIMDVFQHIYFGSCGNGLILKERALVPKTLLARLCRRRPLGIVTGRPRSEALLTLKRLDLDRFFSTLVAAEDTAGRPKPDPRGIRLALKRLGAGRAAYFGDIPDDMAAARAAGVLPVAVFSGPRAARPRWESRMKEAGARIILENLRDCEEAIL